MIAQAELATIEEKLTQKEKATVLDNATQATPAETVEILVNAGVIEPKPWWTSVGIKGSVGTATGALAIFIVAVAKAFGAEIEIGVAEMLASGLYLLASAVATWWGRVYANQPIDSTKVLPGITLKEK